MRIIIQSTTLCQYGSGILSAGMFIQSEFGMRIMTGHTLGKASRRENYIKAGYYNSMAQESFFQVFKK